MVHHLYYHVPFCHRICPYCGFYKHQPGKVSMHRFVDALAREMEQAFRYHEAAPRTIYFGGGTPSLLSASDWTRLREHMAVQMDLSAVEEWTLEANPRTVDEAKARIWRDSGVTRISLGVQSFDAEVLLTLGRDHTPEEASEAAMLLQETGFEVVNIDLMFAIPGQSLETWESTLWRALDLQPDHISAYNLTYEEDTEFLKKFESGDWSQDGDRDAEYFLLADRMLGEAGFEHYEVSNYAPEANHSLHNRAYWAGTDYLGFGPSAVTTIGTRRWKNLPDTAGWAEQVEQFGHAWREVEDLTEEQRGMERLALGLRTSEGILPFAFGIPLEKLEPLREEGLLTTANGQNVRLTLEGMMIADEIAGYLV